MTVLLLFGQGELSLASPRVNLPTPLSVQAHQTVLAIQGHVTEIVIDGD